jgi:hypothetical protein
MYHRSFAKINFDTIRNSTCAKVNNALQRFTILISSNPSIKLKIIHKENIARIITADIINKIIKTVLPKMDAFGTPDIIIQEGRKEGRKEGNSDTKRGVFWLSNYEAQ